jgi:hypothetical protein
VFAVIGLLLLFVLIRGAVLDSEPSSPPAESTLPVPSTQIVAELAEILRLTPRPIPTPNPEAMWAERLRLSGSEVVRSEPFELNGGLVRLRYTLDGNVTLLAITVLADSAAPAAGLPDVMASPGHETERLLVRAPGAYRLTIQPITLVGEGTWTVVVEEEETPASS